MKIARRGLLKSLGAITASSVFRTGKASAEAKSTARSSIPGRPNILVFFSDDHGQWLQQAYGNSEVQTPNMTRIARDGVRMTNAFTTSPVCSPARASFFTGRMPSQHGIHDWIEESKQAYAYPWLKGQTLISELIKEFPVITLALSESGIAAKRGIRTPDSIGVVQLLGKPISSHWRAEFLRQWKAHYRQWPSVAVADGTGCPFSSCSLRRQSYCR